MSTASTAATPSVGSQAFAVMQRVGRSLMLPIAVLPGAAILLRLGQDDMLGKDGLGWDNAALIIGAAGSAVFDNLPMLFALGVAIGFAKKADGSTALAALVGFLVMNTILVKWSAAKAIEPVINPGVFGGILSGLIAAILWEKYHRIRLPDWLAFFGGRRFVPIVTSLACIVLGVAFIFVWPPIGNALESFADWLTGLGPWGPGIYGVANRGLLPLGLHHILNTFLWFQYGTYVDPTTGQPVHGDIPRFFAGDPDAGIFQGGFYPIMMFALPALCLAIVHTARPSQRKVVMGIFLSAAVTSFVTGITEPIEFAFMFLAPVLYALHALLTGVSMFVITALGVLDGFGFSAGLIDYVLNWGIATKPELIIPVGLAFGALYYFLFRWAIVRFNIITPGRDPEADDADDANVAD